MPPPSPIWCHYADAESAQIRDTVFLSELSEARPCMELGISNKDHSIHERRDTWGEGGAHKTYTNVQKQVWDNMAP